MRGEQHQRSSEADEHGKIGEEQDGHIARAWAGNRQVLQAKSKEG